jgi:hypothetical protein
MGLILSDVQTILSGEVEIPASGIRETEVQETEKTDERPCAVSD